MDSKRIARLIAIRTAVAAKAVANGETRPARRRRANVSVSHDPVLAACVEASGFQEHREAA